MSKFLSFLKRVKNSSNLDKKELTVTFQSSDENERSQQLDQLKTENLSSDGDCDSLLDNASVWDLSNDNKDYDNKGNVEYGIFIDTIPNAESKEYNVVMEEEAPLKNRENDNTILNCDESKNNEMLTSSAISDDITNVDCTTNDLADNLDHYECETKPHNDSNSISGDIVSLCVVYNNNESLNEQNIKFENVVESDEGIVENIEDHDLKICSNNAFSEETGLVEEPSVYSALCQDKNETENFQQEKISNNSFSQDMSDSLQNNLVVHSNYFTINDDNAVEGKDYSTLIQVSDSTHISSEEDFVSANEDSDENISIEFQELMKSEHEKVMDLSVQNGEHTNNVTVVQISNGEKSRSEAISIPEQSFSNFIKSDKLNTVDTSTHVFNIEKLDDVSNANDSIYINRQISGEDNYFIAAVNADFFQAEARLAQRKAARAEARELRLRELERKQKENPQDADDETFPLGNGTISPVGDRWNSSSFSPKTNLSFYAKSNRAPSIPRSRTSLPSNSISRRSSEDSLNEDALPVSSRELKCELAEVSEKFRQSMITNAQLDNEKSTLTYHVDSLKDSVADLQESNNQLKKEYRRKNNEAEQLKKLTTKLKDEVKLLRRILQERDELIQEYGLVLIGDENGEASDESYDDLDDPDRLDETVIDLSPRKIAVRKALLTKEASDLLSAGACQGSLDVRLKKYAQKLTDLEDENRRLRLELEEQHSERKRECGLDHEKQKEANKSINEYKFQVQKAEAEVSMLQANVARLDSLVTRYKAATDELEKSEEELKQEKRKLQRELRESQNRLEELEVTTSYLTKRFEKLKNAQSALLKDISLDPPP